MKMRENFMLFRRNLRAGEQSGLTVRHDRFTYGHTFFNDDLTRNRLPDTDRSWFHSLVGFNGVHKRTLLANLDSFGRNDCRRLRVESEDDVQKLPWPHSAIGVVEDSF